MKLSFKYKIHNCDKHLKEITWNDGNSIVEYIIYCTKCRRIKEHWAYGEFITKKYKKKDYLSVELF